MNIKQPAKKLATTLAIASTFASFPAHSLQMTASNDFEVGGILEPQQFSILTNSMTYTCK